MMISFTSGCKINVIYCMLDCEAICDSGEVDALRKKNNLCTFAFKTLSWSDFCWPRKIYKLLVQVTTLFITYWSNCLLLRCPSTLFVGGAATHPRCPVAVTTLALFALKRGTQLPNAFLLGDEECARVHRMRQILAAIPMGLGDTGTIQLNSWRASLRGAGLRDLISRHLGELGPDMCGDGLEHESLPCNLPASPVTPFGLRL